jgi:hypothetical protein
LSAVGFILILLFSFAQRPRDFITQPALLHAARDPAYRAAMHKAQQRRYKDALSSFQHLAASASDANVRALALYQVGFCYLALNQKSPARAALQRFVASYPATPLTAPAQAKILQLTQHATRNTPASSLIAHPSSHAADCGPAALLALCQRLGVKATKAELSRLAGTDDTGTTMAGLAKAAKAKGLTTEGLWVDATAFQQVRLPALAWVNGNHWVAVLEVKQGKVRVFDPAKDGEETVGLSDFQPQWEGSVLRVWKEGP